MFFRNHTAFLLGWRKLIIISWCLTLKQLNCDDQRRWSDKGPQHWGGGGGPHTRPTRGTGTLYGLLNEGALRGRCGQTVRGHGDAPPVSIIQQSDIKVLQLGRVHLRRLTINKQSGLYYAWMILWKSAASHSKGGLWGRIKHFQQARNHANATTTQSLATLSTCNCSKELKRACGSYWLTHLNRKQKVWNWRKIKCWNTTGQWSRTDN